MPATALKAADKQSILKKLVTEMKRRYGGSVPKHNRTTFETLLFAACLEDLDQEQAEAAYSRMLDAFFDLNEIRVSSVSEIELALGDIENAAWKGMRVREALQHVFERYYAFDLEFLKRKTQEQAVKELSEIPHQTTFIRGYVIQQSLGAHVLPVDQSICNLLIWLGLSDKECHPEQAGEDLKSAVKKSDDALVCHLLRCVATDPKLRDHFEDGVDDEVDAFEAPQRLAALFKNPQRKSKKKKAVSRKKPAKKSSSRTSNAKSTKATKKKVSKKVPSPKKTTRKRK